MHDEMGTIYLLHFDRPYGHARHYVGWTSDLPARLKLHESGGGARLLAVIRDADIGWRLTRTWKGTRSRERQIKRGSHVPRRCPECNPNIQVRDA